MWIPWVLSPVVVAAIITGVFTLKNGIRGDERAARRDEATAADAFTGRLLTRLEQLESRTDSLERARRDDAVRLSAASDHIDALEDHIRRGLPPPPPPRPPGL